MSAKPYALCVLFVGAALLVSAQNQKKGRAAQSKMPENVEKTADIVYATYGEKQLRLDLYTPKPKPAGLIPGIVVIRGGGWRQGDKNGFASIAAGLAAKGFAAACIEYRVLPDVKINDCVKDTKAAVRWMRAEGKRYGIQADAIGAIGGSAGGHLVALLATSSKVSKLEGDGGHAGVSSRIQASVPMAPVVDFTSFAQKRGDAGGASAMFGNEPEMVKVLSPVTHIDRDSAPILLIHGSEDKTVPITQSQEMLERYKKAGLSADLVTIDGAPHSFWNMPQWSAETIDKSAQFFHSVLDRIGGGAGAR
jgi:acetyl esterase/lipase